MCFWLLDSLSFLQFVNYIYNVTRRGVFVLTLQISDFYFILQNLGLLPFCQNIPNCFYL
jgi:hypothetical protein